MIVDRKSVGSLFNRPVQYEIPIYQRRYVWGMENWDTLWKNIIDNFEGRTESKHFTGAIVTRHIPEVNGKQNTIEKYEIIDGQQRLTTFQIILCAFKDLCKSDDSDSTDAFKKRVKVHIANPTSRLVGYDDIIDGDIDSDGEPVKKAVYKLLPTDYDSKVFRAIINQTSEENNDKSYNIQHSIQSAYNNFSKWIGDYVGDDNGKMVELLNSFIGNFEVAVINLDKTDQSQDIFLSINATGRQLSEFDYFRNYIFLQTIEKEKRNSLYNDYWHRFEIAPWTTEKLDKFFRVFLMAKLGSKVFRNDTKLFDLYQEDYVGKLTERNQHSENELTELSKCAEIYKDLDDPDSKFGNRIQFYKDLSIRDKDNPSSEIKLQHQRNIVRVQSFILHLKNELSRQDEELSTVFEILESYIARRLLVDPVDDWYGFETIEIYLNQLVAKARYFTIDDLVGFLSLSKKSGRRKWTSNSEVERQFKRGLHREDGSGRRFRDCLWFAESYILFRIENLKRQKQGEDPLPLNFEDFYSTFSYRERMINTRKLGRDAWTSPGNLTLCIADIVRPAINSFAKEKEFLQKKSKNSTYKNTTLLLNMNICEHVKWDRDDIYYREQDLLNCFFEIWKPADEFSKTSAKYYKKSGTSSIGGSHLKWISVIDSDPSQLNRFQIRDEDNPAIVLSKTKVIRNKQVEGIDSKGKKQVFQKSKILFTCSCQRLGKSNVQCPT